jgi:hypothetical protein
MKNHFQEHGIQFEFTVSHAPQQNGTVRVELMHRTMMEKAQCLQLNSRFLTDAVLAAVYLINWSPSSAFQNKVQAELWHGEKPDLRKMKVFGCVAYLHIPKEFVSGKFE